MNLNYSSGKNYPIFPLEAISLTQAPFTLDIPESRIGATINYLNPTKSDPKLVLVGGIGGEILQQPKIYDLSKNLYKKKRNIFLGLR